MKHRRLSLLTGTLLLGLVVVMLLEFQTQTIRRYFDDVVMDNRNHYLNCDQLPSVTEVEAVMKQHQYTLKRIERINPGLVGVYSDSSACPGKADIVFYYGSHEDRIKVEAIIGSEDFFGIPYRLVNQ